MPDTDKGYKRVRRPATTAPTVTSLYQCEMCEFESADEKAIKAHVENPGIHPPLGKTREEQRAKAAGEKPDADVIKEQEAEIKRLREQLAAGAGGSQHEIISNPTVEAHLGLGTPAPAAEEQTKETKTGQVKPPARTSTRKR